MYRMETVLGTNETSDPPELSYKITQPVPYVVGGLHTFSRNPFLLCQGKDRYYVFKANIIGLTFTEHPLFSAV